MALMITDTGGGNRQRMRCPAARARGLQAEGEFVGEQEGLWHS
jgi:hypothetical protein